MKSGQEEEQNKAVHAAPCQRQPPDSPEARTHAQVCGGRLVTWLKTLNGNEKAKSGGENKSHRGETERGLHA